jgi:hypothetical protein
VIGGRGVPVMGEGGKGGGLGSDELGVEFPGTTVGEKRQLLGWETSADRETSAGGKRSSDAEEMV